MRMVSLFMLIPFWRALCIAKLIRWATRTGRDLARNFLQSWFFLNISRFWRCNCRFPLDVLSGFSKPLPHYFLNLHIDIIVLLVVLWAQHETRLGRKWIHEVSGCPHIPKRLDEFNSLTKMASGRKHVLWKQNVMPPLIRRYYLEATPAKKFWY